MRSHKKNQKSRSDAAVQGTNDSSILSKCSMSQVGYFQDDFLKYFAAKKARRSPLINRGYYIRAKALDYVLKTFLKSKQGEKKQILSLGAGFDSAYFRLKSEGLIDKNTVFVEIDFLDVVKRKLALIQQSQALRELLGDLETESCDPLLLKHLVLRSADYILLGVDLTGIPVLSRCMSALGVTSDCPTLLLSEVVITYMTTNSSNAVITWAAQYFSQGVFAAYEQVYPEDGFGQVMMRHFKKLGSPLRSISSFPTPVSQVERYKGLGWDSSVAVDMNCFYNHYVDTKEKQRIEILEPFDEHEEWQLKCMHYVIITAFQPGTRYLSASLWGENLMPQGSVSINTVQNSSKEDLATNPSRFGGEDLIGQVKTSGISGVSDGVIYGYSNGGFCFTLGKESSCNPNDQMERGTTQRIGHVLKLVVDIGVTGLRRFGHRGCRFDDHRFLVVGGFGEREKKQHSRFKDLTLVDERFQSVSRVPVVSRNETYTSGNTKNHLLEDKDTNCEAQGGLDLNQKQVIIAEPSLAKERPSAVSESKTNASAKNASQLQDKKGKCTKQASMELSQSPAVIAAERLFPSLVQCRSGKVLLFGGRTSPLCPLTDLCLVALPCPRSELTGIHNMTTRAETSSKVDLRSCDKRVFIKPASGRSDKSGENFSGEDDDNKDLVLEKQDRHCSASAEIKEPLQDLCQCVTIETNGESPCGRWRHVACEVIVKEVEYMFLHGGVTVNSQVLGDCYLLNVHTSTWYKVTEKGSRIGCLHSHSVALYNNSILLSGGLNEDSLPSNRVLSLKFSQSSDSSFEVLVTPVILQSYLKPRYSHTSAVVEDHLVLVGGVSLQYPIPHLTAIHLSTGSVKNARFQRENVEEPLLLHNHQMAVVKKTELLIFGGGGNCFSFGTHLNSVVYSTDIRELLEEL